jgi:hypothetical protein
MAISEPVAAWPAVPDDAPPEAEAADGDADGETADGPPADGEPPAAVGTAAPGSVVEACWVPEPPTEGEDPEDEDPEDEDNGDVDVCPAATVWLEPRNAAARMRLSDTRVPQAATASRLTAKTILRITRVPPETMTFRRRRRKCRLR